MPSYVVSGASRGIGYGFITKYASIPGNTVIGLVRNKAAVEEKLAKDGITNVHILVADVTDVKAIVAAAEETSKIAGGSLDILINNAAFLVKDLKDLPDFTHEEIDAEFTASFAANVTGVAHVVNAFLPLIRKGQEKKIVTISSGLGDIPLTRDFEIANASPYSVSKTAVDMLILKYHNSLKKEGILSFGLSPGVVDTHAAPEGLELQRVMEMGAKFVSYAPDFKGPITVEESVNMQVRVIDDATVEKVGGQTISHLGSKQWL